MFNFTAPGGRAYLSIRSSNPDPKRRFVVTVSEGFGIGADGLRDLAKQINNFADEVDPKAKKAPATKTATKKAADGDAE